MRQASRRLTMLRARPIPQIHPGIGVQSAKTIPPRQACDSQKKGMKPWKGERGWFSSADGLDMERLFQSTLRAWQYQYFIKFLRL
jgi:hypothetical protein